LSSSNLISFRVSSEQVGVINTEEQMKFIDQTFNVE